MKVSQRAKIGEKAKERQDEAWEKWFADHGGTVAVLAKVKASSSAWVLLLETAFRVGFVEGGLFVCREADRGSIEEGDEVAVGGAGDG